MRLILSRKGFDSRSGGCPSPIFPDGSMIALPIPDKTSPIRYCDLQWRGRNLGDVVARLTKGRQRYDYRAHLDPDLRRDILPRQAGWRPTLGQLGSAEGHLRAQGVGRGDLFLFWGLFRRIDDTLRWVGLGEHHIWGWMQIDNVVSVDEEVRGGGEKWRWASRNPHLAFDRDPSNTLYIGAERLTLPRDVNGSAPGFGTFETIAPARRLTGSGAISPLDWSLPGDFFPNGRRALTFHGDVSRWSIDRGRALLRAAAPGQEFVLDLDHYPGVLEWVERTILDVRSAPVERAAISPGSRAVSTRSASLKESPVRLRAGSPMKTLKNRILELVTSEPGLTDRELTDRLVGKGAPPQQVNPIARQLASSRHLSRRERPDGRIGNYCGGTPQPTTTASAPVKADVGAFLSEDDAKHKLQAWLEADGWKVKVVLGRGHGIDMEARRGSSRWIIEVKGQGTLNAMRVNFFLGVLGELLQRMDDPHARYSLAVPDLPQFRRLWLRLPRLAKERTRISALFVSGLGIEEVQ